MYSLSILRKSVISVCLASTLIISYLTSQISIDREHIKKISLKYIENSCHKFMRLHLFTKNHISFCVLKLLDTQKFDISSFEKKFCVYKSS